MKPIDLYSDKLMMTHRSTQKHLLSPHIYSIGNSQLYDLNVKDIILNFEYNLLYS